VLFEEGEAILSRYPLHDVDFAELRPRAGFFEHRMVLGATVVTPRGEVRVFVTHLTNGDVEVNRAQADSLLTFVTSAGHDLAIIAGDFNATEDSPQIRTISEEAVDAYRLLHPEGGGPTCCLDDLSSGRRDQLTKRIDYAFVFASPEHDVRVLDCDLELDRPFPSPRGWLWVSDHVGLIATLWRD
jgi:endonuclease/exonuclease/phosphatase family metal-dependent hydrolase